MKTSDIMSTKVVTVTEDATVNEVATLMVEKDISGVPVIDAKARVVGMISEGDLIRRHEIGTDRPRSKWISVFMAPESKAKDFIKTHGLHARDVMVQPVIYVSEDATLAAVADLMAKKRVKRLPVTKDGRLVGLVSRADLVRALATRSAVTPPPPGKNDTDIRDAVNQILREEDWAASAMVNVIVSDGNVQLWGVIDTENQRKALRVAVEGIPGVKGLEDHLTKTLPT